VSEVLEKLELVHKEEDLKNMLKVTRRIGSPRCCLQQGAVGSQGSEGRANERPTVVPSSRRIVGLR